MTQTYFSGEKKDKTLVETLEVISDERLMASLRRSIQEAKQKKLIPWEYVKRKLKLGSRTAH